MLRYDIWIDNCLLLISIATIIFNDQIPPSDVQSDPKPKIADVSLPDQVITFPMHLKDDLEGLVRDIKQFFSPSCTHS